MNRWLSLTIIGAIVASFAVGTRLEVTNAMQPAAAPYRVYLPLVTVPAPAPVIEHLIGAQIDGHGPAIIVGGSHFGDPRGPRSTVLFLQQGQYRHPDPLIWDDGIILVNTLDMTGKFDVIVIVGDQTSKAMSYSLP